ncbi:non-heme iron oxygenase ferredoxin subunit [Thioalkalicoccus limnaeus]|uniref:Non-heme iron oxygenase ferredoxin subunit n=1 Tax=Thioalkalicoccus limnaeus TaxID=120681 RepID=A0ABV4BFP2_9GAMM
MEYHLVAQVDEIPPGTMKGVTIGRKAVLITNIDGQYHAIGNICTHFGGELDKGQLEGKVVTCRRHGAQFDVTTGRCLARPAKKDEPLYEVKVEDGGILVAL